MARSTGPATPTTRPRRPHDTLIIVTADHETGGMSIGFAGTKYEAFFDKVSLQKASYVRFDTEVLKPYKAAHTKATAKLAELLAEIEKHFGLKQSDLNEMEQEMVQRAFVRSMGGAVERSVNEDTYLLYGGYEPLTVSLTHLLNQKVGIGWASYSHTGHGAVPQDGSADGHDRRRGDGPLDPSPIASETGSTFQGGTYGTVPPALSSNERRQPAMPTRDLVFLPTGFERNVAPNAVRARARVLQTDDSGMQQVGIVKVGEQQVASAC